MEALVEQKQLAPKFENFRKDEVIALAGPQRRARAKAGTVRRIKAGANREPVC
jgi:hypothetical protein